MPSVSKKQHNLMAAVAKNPAFAKKAGIPQRVGADFMKADKGRKFAKGGDMKESKEMMKKEVAFMKKKKAPPFMIEHEMKEVKGKKKPAKFAKGGGCELKGKTKAFAMGGMPMAAPTPTAPTPRFGMAPPPKAKPSIGATPAPSAYAGPVPTGTVNSGPNPTFPVGMASRPPRDSVKIQQAQQMQQAEAERRAQQMQQAQNAPRPQVGMAQRPQVGMAPRPQVGMAPMGLPTGMKKGGAVKTFAKGGGCELKGKTKGRII